jgi:hypothetical protein
VRVRPLYLLATITALAGVLRLILLDQHPLSDTELAALGPTPISPAPLLHVIYAIIARFKCGDMRA